MDSIVKLVFKVLAGTAFVIAFGAVAIEYMNLSMTAQQLRNDIGISLSNACEAFNQESYRSTELDNIRDEDGNVYISGNVYGKTVTGETEYQTYDRLFGYTATYDNYYRWLTGTGVITNKGGQSFAGIYEDLGYLELGLSYLRTHGGNYDVDIGINNYEDVTSGVAMVGQCYTPMNLGVPYIGELSDSDNAFQSTTNLFKWNLTQMWSKCSSDMIKNENDGTARQYVQRDGWRIYADQAKITSIEYLVYDTQSSEDRQELYNLVSVGESQYVNTSLNNRYVTLIRVGYEVPAGYIGITPFGRIINYVMTAGMQENTADVYHYNTTVISSEDRGDYVYYYNID